MTTHAPRYLVGQNVGYGQIVRVKHHSNIDLVRYRVRTSCCRETQDKSHKSLRVALLREWRTCPSCQRKKAARLRAKLAKLAQEAQEALMPKLPPVPEPLIPAPVVLPDWFKRVLASWSKPPSIEARIWGQQ